jgi:hypothetical protein
MIVKTSPLQYSVGVQIICELVDEQNVPIDISGATILRIYVEKPSGVIGYWDADFYTDGRDGKLQFITTSEDDLDEYGRYRIQALCEDNVGKFPSSVSIFQVKKGIYELNAEDITISPSEGEEEEGSMSLIKQCVVKLTTRTSDPISSVAYNDLSGTPAWTRESKGVTIGTLPNGGFPVGRTVVQPIGWLNIKTITNPTDTTIRIETDDDSDLVARTFVITVYPPIT